MNAEKFRAELKDHCYVKPIDAGNRMLYEIHSYLGELLCVAERHDVAYAIILQHGMKPMAAH